jgi:hypothetical protein
MNSAGEIDQLFRGAVNRDEIPGVVEQESNEDHKNMMFVDHIDADGGKHPVSGHYLHKREEQSSVRARAIVRAIESI